MKTFKRLSLVLVILVIASMGVFANTPPTVTEPITIEIWHTRRSM